MEQNAKAGMGAQADLVARNSLMAGIGMATHYKVECFSPDGTLKWVEEFDNLVVNEGLNDLLDKYLKGSTYTAAHYVGLKGPGTVAAGDTLGGSPEAAWAEINPYSGNRPSYTPGTVASQSVDNSASKASYSITSSADVYGAFLCTVASGQGGTLYGAGDFSSMRTVANGDTLNVTITCTAAAA